MTQRQGIDPGIVSVTQEVPPAPDDVDAPEITEVNFLALTDTDLLIKLLLSEKSTIHLYVGREEDLTVDEVLGQSTARKQDAVGGLTNINIGDLEPETEYVVYIIALDPAGNASELFTQKIITEKASPVPANETQEQISSSGLITQVENDDEDEDDDDEDDEDEDEEDEDDDDERSDPIDTTAPRLTNVSTSSVTEHTANLHFTSSEDATVYIHISTSSLLSAAEVRASADATFAVTANLTNTWSFTGLMMDTAYYLYVIAQDGAGNTSSLESRSVTTAADELPPLISSTKATRISGSSAILEFVSDESGTGYFLISPDPGLSVSDVQSHTDTSTVSVTAIVPYTHTFSNLIASTTYYTYAFVEDTSGNQSELIELPAVADVTSPTLSSVHADHIAPDSASLLFTSDEPGTVYFLASTNSNLNATAVIAAGEQRSVSTGASSHSFTGLTEQTDYTLYAVIEDTSGNLSLVNAQSITTLDGTAPVISDISADNITGETADLSFTSDESGTAYVLVSVVAGLNAATVKETATDNFTVDTSPREYTFTNLEDSTVYVLYVVVEDSSGNLSLVATETITTDDITSPVLSSLVVESITASSAELNFTSDEGGIAYALASTESDLDADAIRAGSSAQTVNVGESTLSFGGLISETDYTLYVLVEDTSGNISDMGSVTVTTLDDTAPIVSSASSSDVTGSSAILSFNSDEGGTYYILATETNGLTAEQVKNDPSVVPGVAIVGEQIYSLTELSENTEYEIYVVVEDVSSNLSIIRSVIVMTLDVTAPALSQITTSDVTGTSATLNFSSDEASTAYLLVSIDSTLNADAVKAAGEALSVDAGESSHAFDSLDSETDYILYVVAEDASGNLSTVSSALITTLDNTDPTVSAVSSVNVTDMTLDLTYTSDEMGTYYVLVSETIGLTADDVRDDPDAKSGIVNVGEQTYSFTDLTASTEYELYILVEDASGNLSEVVSVSETTLDLTAPVVRSENVTDIMSDSARLSFVSDEAGTAYVLVSEVSNLTNDDVKIAAIDSFTVDTTVQSHLFVGLTENTEYTFYVVVEDGSGNLSVSTSATAKTLDPNAPTLSDVSVGDIQGSSASLIFTSDKSGTYYVLASETDGLTNEEVKAAADANSAIIADIEEMYTFTGLAESTDYIIYVVAENTEGSLSAASSNIITTLDVTAPIVSGLSTENVTGTSADLNFTSDEAGTAYLLASVTAGLDAIAIKADVSVATQEISAGNHAHNFDGLTEETVYTLYVVVEDASGNTSLVGSELVTTVDITAPVISELSTSSVAETSLDVTFVSNEIGTYYVLVSAAADLSPEQIKVDGDTTSGQASVGTQSETFTDLIPGTNYYIYVILVDASTNQSNTESIEVTTDAPDITAPILSSPVIIRTDAENANLEIVVDENVTLYFLASATAGLSVAEIIEDASTIVETAAADETIAQPFGSLNSEVEYYLYAVGEDVAGNRSNVIVGYTGDDPLTPVFAVGDSRGVSTQQIFTRLREDLTAASDAYTVPCSAAVEKIYPSDRWSRSGLPHDTVSSLASSKIDNYPILTVQDEGRDLYLGYVGADSGGSAYTVMSINLFFDSLSEWDNLATDVTLNTFAYLLGRDPRENILQQEFTILASDIFVSDSLSLWLANIDPTHKWTILTEDRIGLGISDTDQYDLFVGGRLNRLEDHMGALRQGKPVLYYTQGTAEFDEADILSLYGLTRDQEIYTQGLENGLGHYGPSDLCASLADDQYGDQLRLVSSLESDDFDFDYALCSAEISRQNCPGTITDSRGVSMNDRMLSGSQALRAQLKSLDESGTNIFTDTDDNSAKLFVALADKLRQSISYPMKKTSSDGSDFYRAYFADHAVHYARRDNAFQPDVGTFDPDIAAIHDLPTTNCSLTQTSSEYTEATSTGCYAPPGKPITVTRTDTSDNIVRLFVNYQYEESTWLWNESERDSYNRPSMLQSHKIELGPGQLVTLSTPYGGPMYVEWDGTSNPSDFTIDFDGVTKHPYITAFDAVSISDFREDLETNPHNWIDVKTEALEIHANSENFRAGLSQIDSDDSDVVTADDMMEFFDDTTSYTINAMMKAVGYAGGSLGPLSSEILATCAAHGVDCTNSSIHKLPARQHANFDRNARDGDGVSGNPFDANWATLPLQWGTLREHGHNFQTPRTSIFGDRSSEVSNLIPAYIARADYARDHGLEIFDSIAGIEGSVVDIRDESAYVMMQNAIRFDFAPYEYTLWQENSDIYHNDGERAAFYTQTMFKYGSYDLFAYWHLWDRAFGDVAPRRDPRWNAAKDGLGFSEYTKEEARIISAEDFLYIVTSLLDGRDFANWFEVWGITVSEEAKAQVVANGAVGEPTLTMFRQDGQIYANVADVAMPAYEAILDGRRGWGANPSSSPTLSLESYSGGDEDALGLLGTQSSIRTQP